MRCHYLNYTFSAISRVVEVLRARRRDALTPNDILHEQQVIYLRLRFPKTRNRGGKAQHSSADWELYEFGLKSLGSVDAR